MKTTDLSLLSEYDVGVIWCHPNNLQYLKDNIPKLENVKHGYLHYPIDGIEVRTDWNLFEYDLEWEPPYDRFIEYEPKDRSWALPLGIGKMVKKPIFYINRRVPYVGADIKFSQK